MSTPVVAIVFYIKASRKYLIVRRNSAQSGAGFWEFPGGKVEPAETPEAALQREIAEELQVDIKIEKLQFIFKNQHEYKDKTIMISFYLYELPQEISLVLVDHDEFKWCDINEVMRYPLAAADIPVIEYLKGNST